MRHLIAASVLGLVGFSFGGTDCLVGDDFSGGGLTDIWQVGQSSGSVVSATESGGQIRFSAAANTDYSYDTGFAFSSDWYMDMTSDWAISGWWYSNPPTPTYGDTGISLGVMLDAVPSTAYLTYGATVSVGRYNVDGEDGRYQVCNTWWYNDYYLVDQDPYYTDTSGTLYIWYDASADTLYFGDVLYGGDPFTVPYFQSGSPSNSQEAWIGFGAYSAGYVPAYSSSTYRGDDFCILDGYVVGPDVGACCFAESCVETIEFSCDGEWQGVQTDCSYCDADTDGDGDGVPDAVDNCDLYNPDQADCNDNGIGDVCDVADQTSDDCNGNGIPDECDTADGTSFDCDQDLVPDECEPDCDGDGIIDDCDSEPDQDGNGVPDNCDPDCNENGIADGVEILFGWVDDCDGDVIPDECQLADGSATDCDEDGTLDHCQITDDPDLDCDEDGVIDSCAIADGSVEDCNGNAIPDSCDLITDPDLDCDENGVLDSCEMESVLQQAAKLTADDGAWSDSFGHSVAIDAGIAVIGAWADDDYSGSAYVFEQQADGTWQQTAKLTADDGDSQDYFGYSVALDAGVAVIGANADDSFSGSAYVYEQQGDGTWQQVAKLTADDGASSDNFGYSVALDSGIAVIGAWADDDNGSSSGSAYVFEQQGGGTWQQSGKLTADDGASGDRFGHSVALDAGIAVIGALLDDDNGSSSGSAYVYEQQGDGTWQQVAKLTADDGASSDNFGYSVALDDGVAVIGARSDGDNGSAYVYEQQADGTWQQTAKLTADDGASDDYFGISVATSGGVTVIGANRDDDNGDYSGSAYVYEQQGDGTWQQTAKLTADDGAYADWFGCSVAIADGVHVIGADGSSDYSGSAYVFETFSQADCDANGLIDDCEIEDEPSLDCDLDGVLDSCAIADGSVEDCNENGIPDSCDIADGGDADGDGYLDECECSADIAGPDGPGFPDGIVGTDDLLTVIGYWGSSIPNGDINGDGIVGTDDLLAVIGAWGKCE